jgi:hypothetical protein
MLPFFHGSAFFLPHSASITAELGKNFGCLMELFFGSDGSRHRFSIDWSLIGAATFAAALVLGSIIRTGPEQLPGASAQAGGLQVLGANQHLVSFEDFNFGSDGWTATRSLPADSMASSVLGPLEGGAVGKDYLLPPGTAQVSIAFDLHLAGDWSGEGLSIVVNGEPVVADLANAGAEDREEDAATVSTRRQRDGTFKVRIAVENPGESVSILIRSARTAGAHYSIDNVSVVASIAAS